MAVPYYPGALYTPKLGLGLFGQDEVLAENFVILDSAFGGGSSINVNGSLVISPNLNSTLPSAPVGKSNVIWQVDINGNVSAYASTASSAWATLMGDLTETQVIPWDGGTVGTPDTGISRIGAASLAIGNGTTGDYSGSLTCANLIANPGPLLVGALTTPAIFATLNAGLQWFQPSTGTIPAAFATFDNNLANGPNFLFYHVGGTQASPSTTPATSNLGYISFGGYNGTSRFSSARITAQAATTLTTSNNSTTIQVQAALAGATSVTEVFRFNSNTDSAGDLNGNASGLDLLFAANHGISFTSSSALGGAFAVATDTYISRSAAGVIAIGTVQTIGSATGTLKATIVNALTGFEVNGGAASGNYLRGNGTNFVSSAIQAGDIPSLAATYLPLTGGTISGNLTLSSTLTDGSSSVGTSGQVLSSTVIGIKWVSAGAGTVTNTPGALTQYAVVIGNGGSDETVVGSLGTSGQVLTSGGAGIAPSWQNASGSAGAWSGLTNAGANLTLSNAAYTTEFDQTSAVVWLWKNTTVATSGTTNASPLLELAANYWTGAASAQDTWSIGSSLAAGTNGASFLNIAHNGSTGAAGVCLGSNPAQTGILNIPNGTGIYARNAANNADLRIILTDTSNNIYFGSGGNPGSGSIELASTGVAVVIGGTASFNSNTVLTASSSALSFGLVNSTTATVSTTNASQALTFLSKYWTGAASAQDTWNIQASLAAGANGTPTLTFSHTGSTAATVIALPSTSVLDWSTDTGISRLGAASLAIGNGTASDTTGSLSFGKVIKYNGTATVRNGIAAEYASSDLTAQSAAITATTLLSAPQTGMYKVSWSATITTASDISSVLGGTNGFQVIYTSPTDSVAKTTVPGNSVTSSANTTGTAVGGVEVIYAKTGTNIQFSYGYTDSHTSTAMQYELHITLESL